MNPTTSSPKYPQSNGMAESAVKMIKARLKKSQDPYLGLLAYRTTPLENGFSPSELLMGRKLRTDLPTHPDLLNPTLVNQGLLNQKEHKYREREIRSYNNHWKIRCQKEFDVGDQVWVRDLKVPGTIIGRADQLRSYLVKTPKGQLRRNKIHLAPNYKHKVSRECEENILEVTQVDLPESSEPDPSSCEVELQQDSQGLQGEVHLSEDGNIKTSDDDPCIFIGTHNDSNVILALYVDDGIILSKDKEAIAIIMDELEHAFDITSGSVNFFVGLQIELSEDRASIFIHQSSYIDNILSKFNMADCIPASVPMDPSVILTKQDCPTPEQKEKMPKFPFREAVGSLMFASCVSRPDITYAVSQVSKFLEYPGPAHCTTVKNIFRYLKGTPHMGILFTGQDQLVGYSDSDFARDVDSRKSTSGYAFMMNGGTVSWASQRQPIIALSTTESEYIAACSAAKELIWIRRLLQGIGCDITKETELYIDNQAAIKLVENPVFHKRTKHIDVRYHFIRSKHEEGELKVHHVCSSEQLADIMTKPLPRNKFHYLRGLLNILDREGVPEMNPTTSSPKYPQSNGMAESAVKMIKARLKKSQDPYLGLLAYRTTPLENGFSPSELLMGRKLRTDLPTHPDLLNPTLVNQGLLNQKEHKYREREIRSYNNHWKIRCQKEFDVGDQVWVRDLKVPGTIIGRADQLRSYLVKTPKGQLRRNKIHLAPNYKHKVSRECEENILEVTQVDLPESSEPDPSSCEVELQQDSQGLQGEGGTSRPYITRTGRVVKLP
ncbi:hypothetical protein LAZ67_8000723, partial [Cordylochernes scorpioides]